MSTASTSAPAFMTAEQFAERPDPGYPEELVKGRVVPMPFPTPRHGQVCGKTMRLFATYVSERGLGRFLVHSGVITTRDPDTVRGADLAFYSFARVPKGPLPNAYLGVAPDLVVEVLSPSDRWPKVLAKIAEYLDAGTTVVVLDDERRLAHVFRDDGITRMLTAEEELTIPDPLGDFCVKVSRFFE